MESLGGVEAGKQFGAVRLPAGEEKEARLFRIINDALTFPACSRDYFAGESLKLESGGVPAVCFLSLSQVWNLQRLTGLVKNVLSSEGNVHPLRFCSHAAAAFSGNVELIFAELADCRLRRLPMEIQRTYTL